MDATLTNVLQSDVISERRRDGIISQQALMGLVGFVTLMGYSFVRDATELSIPEAYAVSGLSLATGPREAAASNLGSQTPSTPGSTTRP